MSKHHWQIMDPYEGGTFVCSKCRACEMGDAHQPPAAEGCSILDSDMPGNDIGQAIQDARVAKGWTLAELGRYVSIHVPLCEGQRWPYSRSTFSTC